MVTYCEVYKLKYSPNDKLSPHFSHREVAKSSTADRLELDNTPSEQVLVNAKALADNILEPIRVHFGLPFSPQSWYRGEELEKVLCWKSYEKWCGKRDLEVNDDSWNQYFARKSHPNGEAADIELSAIPNDDLFEWIKNNLEYDQLIREFPKPGDPSSGWVHVSWSSTNNRNQHFTIG